jgi:hypothetical protein
MCAEALPPNLPEYIYIGFKKSLRIAALPKQPYEVPLPFHMERLHPNLFSQRYSYANGVEGGEALHSKAPLYSLPVPDLILPYSVRSYILQLSQIGVADVEGDSGHVGCHYCCFDGGTNKYGTRFIHDVCYPFQTFSNLREVPNLRLAEQFPCGFAKGWPDGFPKEGQCALWDVHQNLMDTDSERLFSSVYLRQNREREAPMLIPQAWIDDTERYRVDFMLFVPGAQVWRKIAVEVLGPSHTGRDQLLKDAHRKRRAMQLGYEFIEFWSEEITKDVSECVRELRDFLSLD